MKKIAWLTDLHLDFASPESLMKLMVEVKEASPDAVLIGGDTAEFPTIEESLVELGRAFDTDIYFVLGNHDYYRGTLAETRLLAKQISRSNPRLHWLPDFGMVQFPDCATVIIGHGGWADGRSGSFRQSTVMLSDYQQIWDLAGCLDDEATACPPLPRKLEQKLNDLGDEAADAIEVLLNQAFENAGKVILLMHVPPFRAACWHEGEVSDDNWAPHFVCEAAGVRLEQVMKANPNKQLLVLCGHTHSDGQVEIAPNLKVVTGGAIYGHPRLHSIIEID